MCEVTSLPPGQFDSYPGFEENGIKEWKGPEVVDMINSNKALPTFVMFYHPKCPWCKKVYDVWVKMGKKFNVDGTGVRIEAVNGSYTLQRSDIGVKTYPDFRLFRAGDDSYGQHFPKVPEMRTVEGFTKFLK